MKKESFCEAVFIAKNGTNVASLCRRIKAFELNKALTQGHKSPGRPTALCREQEEQVTEVCLHFVSRGILLVYEEISALVQDLFGANNSVKSRFKDGTLVAGGLRCFVSAIA